MTDPGLRVALDDFNSVAADPPGAEGNGSQPAAPLIEIETWRQFEQQATETIPCIVDGLWPVGALGFIAAPPKKGKTWIGLSLALSVATGRTCIGKFTVPNALPVLYVALEGHRAALRGRIGCLARGLGIDPDGDELDANLHLTYKPRGINIADPEWANALLAAAATIGAGLVVVDVLRAAAAIKENSQEEFSTLRRHLLPLLERPSALALLHHFGKLTEITKERSPGERMSGSGAMYGAMDVGVFITGSDEGARKLRVEFELRDLAEPDTLGLHLAGDGNAENGGFGYRDTASWNVEEAPDEADLKAPPQEIVDWISEQGGEADSAAVRFAFTISLPTLQQRENRLRELGVEVIHRRGKATLYRVTIDPESDPESATPKDFRGQQTFGVEAAPLHQNGPTPQDPENPATSGVGNGPEQDFLPRKTPDSPTESYDPLAGSALREPPDYDDDQDTEWNE